MRVVCTSAPVVHERFLGKKGFVWPVSLPSLGYTFRVLDEPDVFILAMSNEWSFEQSFEESTVDPIIEAARHFEPERTTKPSIRQRESYEQQEVNLRPGDRVPDFALTNQRGHVVALGDFRGQVWVADIIFTRCPGPCATMTRTMSELQSALPQTQSVKLLSLTADPEFDTPEVLRTYGEKFGAAPERWQFLTGNKLDVYRLATKGLLLAVDKIKADERTKPDDLFVHSTRFVVVDKHGRVRGSFDGTEPSSQPKIVEAIQTLLLEEQP